MRAVLGLACISGLFSLAPVSAHGQGVTLTALSSEQRWDRASMHVTLFTAMFIREGMQAGKTPAQIGRELATFFGPWTSVSTPAAMAQAIHRNWQLWREVEFTVVQDPDGTVRVTTNRPYAAALARYGVIGVSPAEFDAMFASFHETIAGQRGLQFQQTVDSAAVHMTIRGRAR